MVGTPLSADPERVPWSILDVFLIALFAVFGMVFFGVIAFGVAHALPAYYGKTMQQIAKDARVTLCAQLFMYLSTLVFMRLVVLRYGDASFPAAVRWRWPEARVKYLAGGFAMSIVILALSRYLPIPKSLPIDELFHDARTAYWFAAFGILVAPFFEELFFRGFLYPVLRQRLSNPVAIPVTAFCFALIHEPQLAHAWAPLLMIFLVGVVLTLVRARTGSVAASFLVHAGYNATLFLVMYIVTGRFQHFEKLG